MKYKERAVQEAIAAPPVAKTPSMETPTLAWLIQIKNNVIKQPGSAHTPQRIQASLFTFLALLVISILRFQR